MHPHADLVAFVLKQKQIPVQQAELHPTAQCPCAEGYPSISFISLVLRAF